MLPSDSRIQKPPSSRPTGSAKSVQAGPRSNPAARHHKAADQSASRNAGKLFSPPSHPPHEAPVAGMAKDFAGYISDEARIFNYKTGRASLRLLPDSGPHLHCGALHVVPLWILQKFLAWQVPSRRRGAAGRSASWIQQVRMLANWGEAFAEGSPVPLMSKACEFPGIVSRSGSRLSSTFTYFYFPRASNVCSGSKTIL